MKPDKTKPALVGGLILGVLSIIPIVQFGNCFCCLWVLLGSAIAAKMLIDRSPDMPVTIGDGAVVGAMAGSVGALIYLVIGVPLGLLLQSIVPTKEIILSFYEKIITDPVMMEQIRRQIEMAQPSAGAAFAQAIIYGFIFAVIMVVFATLGGIIGVALFEKRKGTQLPPPQPGYGQPPYGGV